MMAMRLALLFASAALLAACAGTEPLESSRGIALRIDDDVDALDAARNQAEDHCDRHDRYPVLQSVSPVDHDQRLASFDCVGTKGGGIAIYVGDHDEDVRKASSEAESYCHDHDKIAVLQSVSDIDHRRIAAFNCVNS
jgi:hypothetical protein